MRSLWENKKYASEFWWSIFRRTFHFETAEIDIYVISLKEYTFVLWYGKQGVIHYMHIGYDCIYFMSRQPCV